MAQCASCLRWGFRQGAPPTFHGRSQLEKYLGELKVDERGQCEQCQAVVSAADTSHGKS